MDTRLTNRLYSQVRRRQAPVLFLGATLASIGFCASLASFASFASFSAPVQAAAALQAAAKPTLAFITVQLNDEPRVINAGEQLDLVAGDRLTLRGVTLTDEAKPRPRVSLNFVGFSGRNPERLWDDTGAEINTATDVLPAHAVNRAENIYHVRAEIAGVSIGTVSVRILKPHLKFAEIQINGASRALRDGELLRIASDDQVKILRFASNVSQPAEVGYRFQRAATTVTTASGAVKAGYEFVFTRGSRAFARIPVRVEERVEPRSAVSSLPKNPGANDSGGPQNR